MFAVIRKRVVIIFSFSAEQQIIMTNEIEYSEINEIVFYNSSACLYLFILFLRFIFPTSVSQITWLFVLIVCVISFQCLGVLPEE
jgi:hypothetical protein